MPSGPGEDGLGLARMSRTVSITGTSGLTFSGRVLVYDFKYSARMSELGAFFLLLQISPPQNVLASLACCFGQVMGGSDGLLRRVWMELEEEGRRGAM